MIIECPHCESKVDGKICGQLEYRTEDYPFPGKSVLVECPVCHSPLLGDSEYLQVGMDEYEWTNLHRVWPIQDSHIDWEIPEIARISLIEAKVCFNAKAFSACAVMCGRAIEGICKHHNTKSKTLAGGLKDLKDLNVIDSRIFEWGEALRTARNLGAHASTEKVSKEDARDLLDFCTAICEYVFVLNEKFERFKARQKKNKI